MMPIISFAILVSLHIIPGETANIIQRRDYCLFSLANLYSGVYNLNVKFPLSTDNWSVDIAFSTSFLSVDYPRDFYYEPFTWIYKGSNVNVSQSMMGLPRETIDFRVTYPLCQLNPPNPIISRVLLKTIETNLINYYFCLNEPISTVTEVLPHKIPIRVCCDFISNESVFQDTYSFTISIYVIDTTNGWTIDLIFSNMLFAQSESEFFVSPDVASNVFRVTGSSTLIGGNKHTFSLKFLMTYAFDSLPTIENIAFNGASLCGVTTTTTEGTLITEPVLTVEPTYLPTTILITENVTETQPTPFLATDPTPSTITEEQFIELETLPTNKPATTTAVTTRSTSKPAVTTIRTTNPTVTTKKPTTKSTKKPTTKSTKKPTTKTTKKPATKSTKKTTTKSTKKPKNKHTSTKRSTKRTRAKKSKLGRFNKKKGLRYRSWLL